MCSSNLINFISFKRSPETLCFNDTLLEKGKFFLKDEVYLQKGKHLCPNAQYSMYCGRKSTDFTVMQTLVQILAPLSFILKQANQFSDSISKNLRDIYICNSVFIILVFLGVGLCLDYRKNM